MDWLILRDVLNTVCNIMSATYKAVGGGWGEWRERVGGLMMPVDTTDQVVYTVGQTDGYSSPDHAMRRANVKWNSLGPQATLLMHPSGPKGSVLVLHGLIGSAKSCL